MRYHRNPNLIPNDGGVTPNTNIDTSPLIDGISFRPRDSDQPVLFYCSEPLPTFLVSAQNMRYERVKSDFGVTTVDPFELH